MSIEIWPAAEIAQAETEEDMPTFEHGMLASRLIYFLRDFIKDKNLGEVLDSSVEYRFLAKSISLPKARQPYKQPDVSFVTRQRLPRRVSSYPEIAPDWAIEVVSPSDRAEELEAKVKIYQKASVRLVWLVRPYSRRVEVYRLVNGLQPESYANQQVLDGAEVLPDFRLIVSALFDYPADPDEEELS